jgi:MFS family permease
VIREHPLAPWFAVGAVCFGAFMGQLDASIVTVAFPALQRQFGTGLASVQWVSLAYLLALTALLVPAGRWSDRFGRKLMYLYGFVIFAASSAACGLAPSLAALVVLRVVQAAGAALLQANSVALVVTSVPAHTRRAALGVQAAAQAVGLAAGPVIGGLLVAAAGWRWVFFLNVPVGLVAVIAGGCLLPRTRGPAGQLLSGRSLARRPGTDPGGTVLPRVSATAGMLALGALCACVVLFGPLVLFPQVVTARGGSAESAGLLLTALPCGFGLAAAVADRLLPAGWPNRRRCLLGGAVTAGSAAALAVPAPDAVSVVLLGLLGIGLGIYTPANNAEIMAAVPAKDAAAAGGMVNMTRGTGTALGVAVVTLGLHAGAQLRSPDSGRTLSMAAIAAVALLAVALSAAAAGPRAGTAPGAVGGAR